MSVESGQAGLLALWSAPRSRSTAFFRMMVERGDVVALHEPFAKLDDHGETELPGRNVTSIDELIDRLLNLAERTRVFFKERQTSATSGCSSGRISFAAASTLFSSAIRERSSPPTARSGPICRGTRPVWKPGGDLRRHDGGRRQRAGAGLGRLRRSSC